MTDITILDRTSILAYLDGNTIVGQLINEAISRTRTIIAHQDAIPPTHPDRTRLFNLIMQSRLNYSTIVLGTLWGLRDYDFSVLDLSPETNRHDVVYAIMASRRFDVPVTTTSPEMVRTYAANGVPAITI